MGCSCDTMKTGFKPGTLQSQPTSLTKDQQAIISETWQTLKMNLANIGVQTFIAMFESRPELIQIFNAFKGQDLETLKTSTLLQDHALRVMSTVDSVVMLIDDRRALAKNLRDLGSVHRTYNVPYDMFQTILPYFINAIKPYIDPWTEEVNLAWFSLFDIVIFYMTEGQITTTTGPPVFNNVALKNVHKTGKQKAHTEAINKNNTVENNLE